MRWKESISSNDYGTEPLNIHRIAKRKKETYLYCITSLALGIITQSNESSVPCNLKEVASLTRTACFMVY